MDEKNAAAYNAKMPDIAKHCSQRERIADEAERDTDALKKVEYMEDKIGNVYDFPVLFAQMVAKAAQELLHFFQLFFVWLCVAAEQERAAQAEQRHLLPEPTCRQADTELHHGN